MADSPDILMRKEKGKQGKLWRIEVLYSAGHETKRVVIDNRIGDEVMKFRERIFQIGLMVPVDPGHWVVISPADILEVHIWKQKKFFHNEYRNT